MGAWESPIIRVSAGRLNMVNDTVIGGQPGLGTSSKFAGQLGKYLQVSQEQIALLMNSVIGTLFGGLYQYVRLSASSAAIALGEVLYWDNAASVASFQVSRTATTGGTLTASMIAGIAINVITPGNYGFVFAGNGIVDMKFVSSITGTAAIGRPVFVDASTVNEVNVIDTDPATTEIWNRYLGWAQELPVNNTVTRVQMGQRPPRG